MKNIRCPVPDSCWWNVTIGDNEVIVMLIDISDAALVQLQDLLSDPANEGKSVRIQVQPG